MPDRVVTHVFSPLSESASRRRFCCPAPHAPENADIARVAASDVGVGTVATITDVVTVEVESVTGLRFTGRLHDDSRCRRRCVPAPCCWSHSTPLRANTFHWQTTCWPFAPLSTRCSSTRACSPNHQLDLIRHGTRSRGVVTGMCATGETREDYREVELDVMVQQARRRPVPGCTRPR